MVVAALIADGHRNQTPEASARAAAANGPPRSVELINHGGPGGRILLDRIDGEMGPAIRAVEEFWGTDWPSQVVIVTTASDRQFAAAAGGAGHSSDVAWSDIAAVAVADTLDPAHRLATGQRIVFAPGATGMDTAALRIVLRHELFHYASRIDTAADAPRWLTEGVADFVARDPGPISLPPDLALPTDADLDSPGTRADAYDRAWWFTRFVADVYGRGALRDLYVAACGPGHVDAPTAVRRVLGAEPADLLADWRHWSARAS